MKIIASTSAFKNDLDNALKELAALGFDAVDLILIESWGLVSVEKLVTSFEEETRRVRDLLEKHGLRARSINTGFSPQLFDRESEPANEERRRQVRAVCRFMRALEIPIGAHYPGHIADWKEDPEGVWKGTVQSLREIQEIAGEEGVVLAPELHFQTPFEHPEDARRLLREVPGLPYTYEPSHFIVNGYAYPATSDLLDGAVHCHLRTSARGQLQCPPPEGLDSVRWMMDRLRVRGYEGLVSIEYLPGATFDLKEAISSLAEELKG